MVASITEAPLLRLFVASGRQQTPYLSLKSPDRNLRKYPDG
jgi:hypothetical protein